MNLRRLILLIVLAAVPCAVAYSQFGIGKLKDKLDSSKNKAKPATDRAEKAIDTFASWPAEQEQMFGDAAAAKMIAEFGLEEDERLNRYVNLVGSAVAQFAPRQLPYRFGVLATDMVGAYALPGGYVFVTRQALLQMNDESELAGVLGHEIIHAAERHLESEIRSNKASQWAVQEGKRFSSSLTPEQLRAQGEALVKDLFNMKLSRDKEDGADERGVALAVQAGYSASGLARFLTTLKEITGEPDGKRALGNLLTTHPAFDDRITRLNAYAEKNPGGTTLENRFRQYIVVE